MPAEYRALWNVPGGGAGYSTFYSTAPVSPADAQAFANAVAAFFGDVDTFIPSNVTISFDSEVRYLQDASGQLVAVQNVTPPAQVPGVAAGAYAAGAGARIDWRTSSIVNGRRVVGRTFLVPIIGSSFESDGTIVAGTLTALGTAATNYIAALAGVRSAVVWHRPINGAGGSIATISSGNVPDKSALLRSRRD